MGKGGEAGVGEALINRRSFLYHVAVLIAGLEAGVATHVEQF